LPSSKPEVEVKIAVTTPAAARRRIRAAGFEIHVARVFEVNVLYDFGDLRLRSSGRVLRLRRAGRLATLTFKGKSVDTRHKVREEIETRLEKPAAMERVFQELELQPVFRYEKFRTEFARDKQGLVTLDETPIGTYLEIEGPPQWIDRTAGELGFNPENYITSSYGMLYLKHCAERGIEPSNMVFPEER
jgi:adenylate cyclase class 2